MILGFLLEKFFRSLFGSPVVAAGFLVVNGILLLLGERLRAGGHRPLSTPHPNRRTHHRHLAVRGADPGHLSSGATIVGGLIAGWITRVRRISRS